MSDRRNLWLASGFVAGLLLTGIPYWRLPFNANFSADPGMLLGMAGLGVATAVLAASGAARLTPILCAMLASFPAAVLIRVIAETVRDPTDHNLWPFELVFAAVVSLIAVIPGLIVGALVRRLKA